MRMSAAVLTIVLGCGLTGAQAEDASALPDLKGEWSGPFRTVIFGHNPHHPGSETVAEPPRVREIVFTMAFEGQDGPLIWGRSWSDPAKKEPFAMTLAADGKTGFGADTDGSLVMTVTAPDQLEICYTQTGLGPSKAIVASCGVLARAK